MKRRELQVISKKVGIKANQKSKFLIEELEEYYEKNKVAIKAASKNKENWVKDEELVVRKRRKRNTPNLLRQIKTGIHFPEPVAYMDY